MTPHLLAETESSQRAAALQHHVLVKVETFDQFPWRAWLFSQSGEAFSKRGIAEEHEGDRQAPSACALRPAIPEWICGHR